MDVLTSYSIYYSIYMRTTMGITIDINHQELYSIHDIYQARCGPITEVTMRILDMRMRLGDCLVSKSNASDSYLGYENVNDARIGCDDLQSGRTLSYTQVNDIHMTGSRGTAL